MSAQDADAAATSEPNLQEPAPVSEPTPEEPALQRKLGHDAVVTDPPPAASGQVTYKSVHSYDQYRLEELTGLARRSRNAMIGTAAAAAVGAALLFPGLHTQCYTITVTSLYGTSEQLQCTSGGWALVSIGGTLFAGGGTGVVISGIMFGVRKGKIRRLKDRMAYEKSRAVRWDPARSTFVF